jgi:hypothetical protein
MKRFILAPLAALFTLLGLVVGPASAQNTYPFQPPRYGPGYQTPLSPYLNFLRGGDPSANYFLGVLPEFQRRENRNQFQSQIQGLTNLLPPRPGSTERDLLTPLSSTGHPTVFGYTGSYFGGMSQSSLTPRIPLSPRNPFQQRQGQGSRWPSGPQPAGQPPQKPM